MTSQSDFTNEYVSNLYREYSYRYEQFNSKRISLNHTQYNSEYWFIVTNVLSNIELIKNLLEKLYVGKLVKENKTSDIYVGINDQYQNISMEDIDRKIGLLNILLCKYYIEYHETEVVILKLQQVTDGYNIKDHMIDREIENVAVYTELLNKAISDSTQTTAA